MDDYRTEAVALIAKMAPLIGKENAEKIFLERYIISSYLGGMIVCVIKLL